METPRSFSGGIVTFYSFKGGVGRSMAVANIGRLLARDFSSGENLLIDWDLEAPGLNSYFRVRPSSLGLVDYFSDLVEALRTKGLYEALQSEDRGAILDREIPIGKYLVDTATPRLWLMTAGPTDPARLGEYQKKVAQIDWADLFHRYPMALRAFREMLTSRFAYTLIDSRTGISDTAGLCTAILPDRLMAMFGPNKQNKPIFQVVEAALEFRRMSDDDRPLIAFPVASRFDPADLLAFQSSLMDFRYDFSQLFARVYNLKDCDLTEYFDQVLLLYVARYGYGDGDVVDHGEPSYAGSLRRSYEELARWLVERSGPWSAI
jgi:hypothetical protein